jgi:hypothetical protein
MVDVIRPPGVPRDHVPRGPLERPDELAPDDLALLLRVAHPASAPRNVSAASTTTRSTPVASTKSFSTCSASPARSSPWSTNTQVSWSADRPVHERGSHRGIHPAGQPAEHPVRRRPGRGSGGSAPPRSTRRSSRRPAGAAVQEVLQLALTERRVQHLGVPLHAVQLAVVVLERRHRRARRRGGDPQPLRRRGDGVAVAHPHRLALGLAGPNSVEEAPARPAWAWRRTRDRPVRCDLAPERARHRLEAVADAEDRYAGREQRRVEGGGAVGVHAARPPGQHDRRGLAVQDRRAGDRVRHDLAVDARLADPPGDELRVLRPEVHDEDGMGVRVGAHPQKPSRRVRHPRAPRGCRGPRAPPCVRRRTTGTGRTPRAG